MGRLSARVAEETRQEWRDFGLYYISDDNTREWHLHGNREGLLRLAEALERYAANPANAPTSEHEHLGPHWYLTVTTWPEPRLDGRGIWGQPKDLERLALFLREALASALPSAVLRVGKQFTPNAEYDLVLHVEPESFDPASLDPQLAG